MYDDRDSSFAACRWAAREQLVTVGASPGVEVWDLRAAGARHAPSQRARGPDPRTRFGCLAVLPDAPHYVAAGAAGPTASVALWDLRRSVR